jgi:hypothetical protein
MKQHLSLPKIRSVWIPSMSQTDFIWDRQSGKQIAWIENDHDVYSVVTKRKFATVRDGRLAAAHVNLENIKLYLDDLAPRVRSVTAWNSISMVRRVARFIAPGEDFSWLREIDNDLAFLMEPKSKMDRWVYAERLVEAGLELIDDAKQFTRTDFERARAIRNGLMLALWPLCGSRRKNFASLEIGKTFKLVRGQWWITIEVIGAACSRRFRRHLRRIRAEKDHTSTPYQ